MAIEERRERAAEILAEGLLRLLIEEGRVNPDDVIPGDEYSERLDRVSLYDEGEVE
jgi:hypothetical protein